MEQTRLLSGCWLQQKKIFIDNLLASRKRPAIASVHSLRTSIKKLRSYLRLKEQINGDKWKESFQHISALFKSFGVVGDLDMSLVLLRHQEHKKLLLFPFFKEDLFLKRSLSRKWARQDAIKFNENNPDAFDQQFNLDLTDKELCEKINQASVLKIRKVKELIRHFHKNAHKIRKLLKDVYNWVKISPEYFDKRFINIEALDQMLKDLGAAQDHFVFRKKIEQHLKDLPANEEHLNLKTLGKRLKTIQNEFLEKAKDTWKEVMPEDGV